MSRKDTPALRCAIYTRKSSEEGLDQAFNSLHAQREACEAYIKSQAGEGWRLIPTSYDDGGISGGTMDRPALTTLMADIERGVIDVVVVYKVDRLTRSLADFAKIIEVFDRRGVSFVSVTQAFNTTSSMGRLTLNVLLSFAQFEREVTGERIRDKIAASKAKGMWMGGMPPLGYDIPTDQTARCLRINAGEAEAVRDIFQRYLRLKSVNALRDELTRDGIHSKAWTTQKGRFIGGLPFSAGSLFHLLQSRVYLGEIVHKTERFPGRHEAIISPELFEAVQAQLAANARARNTRPSRRPKLALQGRIFDAAGDRMVPTFGYGKDGGCYGYYVSKPLMSGAKPTPGVIGRISAKALDALVLGRLRTIAEKPTAEWLDLCPILQRVDILGHGVSLHLDAPALLDSAGGGGISRLRSCLDARDKLEEGTRFGQTLALFIAVRPIFRGGRTWIVRPDGLSATAHQQPDRQLLKALAQAHKAAAEYDVSPTSGADAWRRARSIPASYLRQLAGFAFLAPDIQRAILEGRHPAGLTGLQILQRGVPLAWADQREQLGFPQSA